VIILRPASVEAGLPALKRDFHLAAETARIFLKQAMLKP
jgi:hypothetical protein